MISGLRLIVNGIGGITHCGIAVNDLTIIAKQTALAIGVLLYLPITQKAETL